MMDLCEGTGVGMLPCQQCIPHWLHCALWSKAGALHYPWW